MDIAEIIAQAQGGRGLQALARRYNLDERQARAAVDQLAPAVMAGIRRETETPDTLAGLVGALASGNHRRYLEGDDAGIAEDGNAILGHIFGSKDVSRGVAAKASTATGVDTGTLKQMLPAVAAMVMGALGQGAAWSRQANVGGGGLADVLGQVLGGQPSTPQATAARGGGLGDMFGQFLGAGAGGAPGKGGIEEMLGGIFGSNAPPETRERATRQVGDALGNVLGRGSPQADEADRLLDSLGHHRKSKLDR